MSIDLTGAEDEERMGRLFLTKKTSPSVENTQFEMNAVSVTLAFKFTNSEKNWDWRTKIKSTEQLQRADKVGKSKVEQRLDEKKVREQDAKIKRRYENCQRKAPGTKSYMAETAAEFISDPKPLFTTFYPSFYSKRTWLNVGNENSSTRAEIDFYSSIVRRSKGKGEVWSFPEETERGKSWIQQEDYQHRIFVKGTESSQHISVPAEQIEAWGKDG